MIGRPAGPFISTDPSVRAPTLADLRIGVLKRQGRRPKAAYASPFRGRKCTEPAAWTADYGLRPTDPVAPLIT